MFELPVINSRDKREQTVIVCAHLLFHLFVSLHFYLFGALSGSTANLLFRNRQRVMMGRQLPAVMHYGAFSNAGLQHLCTVGIET